MPIHNLRTIKRPQFAGTVCKGGIKNAKGYYGKDLESKLRFHPFSQKTREAILKFYPDATLTPEQDIILDELHVYLAHDRVDESFVANMELWTAQRKMQSCNRQIIFETTEECQDRHGQTYRKSVPGHKACPVADEPMSTACPMGCVQSGTLFFHVAALEEAGILLPCRMSVHGWSDVIGIPEQLETFLELIQRTFPEWKSIRRSPFPTKGIGDCIPMTLSRFEQPIKRPVVTSEKINLSGRKINKRTGNTADSSTWSILVRPDPYWLEAFSTWGAIQKLKSLGYSPDRRLLSGTGMIQTLDAEIIQENTFEPNSLNPYTEAISQALDEDVPQTEILLTDTDIQDIRRLLNNGLWLSVWNKNPKKFETALLSQFQTKNINQISRSRLGELHDFIQGKLDF